MEIMEDVSGAHFSGWRPSSTNPTSPSSPTAPSQQPFVIGVSGGTASGKTTVCELIIQQLQDHRVVLVCQDSFYRGLTNEELKHVHKYNFDHPDAFDTEQLVETLSKLKSGHSVQVPIYDFKLHQRSSDIFRLVNASDVIIMEGILVFHEQRVRDMMNMKIFVDADPDVRLARRIKRDTVDRGRDVHSVLEQTRGMHTIIRDKDVSKHDFVFYSDRLIRLVVEHGLGYFPFKEKQIITPTGATYTGVEFCKQLCGVSIIRSGESMENALRACCKGIKIGKILIHRQGEETQLIYEKLPNDISERHVLLMDPVLSTGNTASQAIELLINKGVPEANIIFLNLISAPEGINCVCTRFPNIKIITSEIEEGLNDQCRVIPGLGEFGDRYFGTDD
ncbi:Uridine kinase-like protein 1, chloroplastic [Stylosanthes scabra]|uniref:Uridine kinase-like protein 1, chloroplastic n=1 Tax=Stylosanthes scabra TaxID=79078 RepID=A0ABU6YBV0_9FABA|nr:Uridine kinase-like protein 1, chloroplastic [Stylosanthes scabra]